jgi:hypothetical protein
MSAAATDYTYALYNGQTFLLGGDMGARLVSSSQGLRILGPIQTLVLPSDIILLSLPLCFKLEHFIIYVFLL